MKTMSVIIPSYNMEEYLPYCLDSILIESVLSRLEVVVVNDGSNDSTSRIAHEYEMKYPDTVVVIDKSNGNYGSCINAGLNISSGRYIKILDADDSFKSDNFEAFVDFLETIDADLVISDYYIVDASRSVTDTISFSIEPYVISRIDNVCVNDDFKAMRMHAVTYKRSNLIKMGYHQEEGISYTDQQWIFSPMTSVESVSYFDKGVYQYLLGRVGQTMSASVMRKNISQLMHCLEVLVVDFEKYRNEVSSEIKEYLVARLVPQTKGIYLSLFEAFSIENKQLLLAFDARLKSLSEEIYLYSGTTAAPINLIKFWRSYPDFNVNLLRSIVRLSLCVRRCIKVVRV